MPLRGVVPYGTESIGAPQDYGTGEASRSYVLSPTCGGVEGDYDLIACPQ